MRNRSVPLMAILLTLCVVALVSQENGLEGRPIVVRAKTIYTITNDVIENGMILIEQGRIKNIAKKIEITPKAGVYTAEVVMPGMIDAHVHFALDRSSRPDPESHRRRTAQVRQGQPRQHNARIRDHR